MKRHLSKILFIGLIFGAYFLVYGFFVSNEFETKSIKLFKERGAAVLAELEKAPGCADRFELQSVSFNKEWPFSKIAEGRSIYTARGNVILDISWSAEVVDNGRMIIVKPKSTAELQATLMSLMLRSCQGS